MSQGNRYQARPIGDPQVWDDLAARLPHSHFMQSSCWGRLRERLGWAVERWAILECDVPCAGAQVLFRSTPLGTVAYIPRGPMLNWSEKDQAEALFAALHRQARSRSAIFLKAEPAAEHAPLASFGFRPSLQAYQPKATIVIDIAPDLDAIAARQKSKTRYNIRLAGRRGVSVRQAKPEELSAFYRLLQETAKRDGFVIRHQSYYRDLLESFGDAARLLLAEYDGQVLAGIIVCAFGAEATYLYGASGSAHRNLMPNHLLQWEAIRWAKERGCTRYDMWGIPEAAVGDAEARSSPAPGVDPGRNLWGVHQFKSGFGGTPLLHAGAYDFVYSPWRYLLWERLVPLYLRLRGADLGA